MRLYPISTLLLLHSVTSFTPSAILPSRNGVISTSIHRNGDIAPRLNAPTPNHALFSTLERNGATASSSSSTTSSSSTASSVVKPNGMEHSWEVHKFGGGECCCACLLHSFCPSSLSIPTSLTMSFKTNTQHHWPTPPSTKQ